MDKLLKYMEVRIEASVDAAVERSLADTKEQISHIYSTLDSVLDRLETNETERMVMENQLDRVRDRVDEHEGRIARLEANGVR